jgi:hypothetical protein
MVKYWSETLSVYNTELDNTLLVEREFKFDSVVEILSFEVLKYGF